MAHICRGPCVHLLPLLHRVEVHVDAHLCEQRWDCSQQLELTTASFRVSARVMRRNDEIVG